MLIDRLLAKRRRKKDVQSAWVDAKYFDFSTSKKWLAEYRDSLDIGALCIKEDNNVYEEYISNGMWVKSLDGETKCDGVELSTIGTPCIYYKFKNGNEGYIECYIRGEVNTLAGKGIKHVEGGLVMWKVDRVFRQLGKGI